MNARPLVALGFLSLVGGATVWKLTRPDPHARKADEVTLASVPSLDPGSIDELELKEPKKPRVVHR